MHDGEVSVEQKVSCEVFAINTADDGGLHQSGKGRGGEQ
jgi:hypothetical protein